MMTARSLPHAVRLWRVVATAATLAMIAGTLLPAKHLPRAQIASMDKLLHVVAFAGVTVLWRFASLSLRRTLLLMAVLAVGTELAQHIMRAGRSFDAYDLVANGAGVVLGLGIAGVVLRALPKVRSSSAESPVRQNQS